MKIKGIKCGFCKDEIWSRHTHDFRACKCGSVFVDGGKDYLRYGGLKPEVKMEGMQIIDIEVPDDTIRYSAPL